MRLFSISYCVCLYFIASLQLDSVCGLFGVVDFLYGLFGRPDGLGNESKVDQRSLAIEHADVVHQLHQGTFKLQAMISRVLVVRLNENRNIVGFRGFKQRLDLATMLFAVTFLPTTPQVTPSGLIKSL